MGQLTYATTISLDGYVSDENRKLDWSVPDEAVFDKHLERIQQVSTEILGRTTYQMMQYWENYDPDAGTAAEAVFAEKWRTIDKIVVSNTMDDTDRNADRERLVRSLSIAEVKKIVNEADGQVEIFGPTTAAESIRSGLVEVFEFFIVPVVLGAGLRALPDGVRLDLRLTDRTVFENGVIHARYERAAGF